MTKLNELLNKKEGEEKKTSKVVWIFAIIGIIAAVAAAVGMGGCNGNKGTASTGQYLTMGTNAEFPPFEYREGDKVVVFDVEVAERVAKKMGKTLKIADMTFDGLIPALQSGKIDMIVAGKRLREFWIQ